jgi:hypothetical protein
MRIAAAFGVLAFTVSGVLAEDRPDWPLPPYAAQQMCYTWIAMAAGFAEPETERDDWQKFAYRIGRSLSDRTDTDAVQAKIDTDAATKVANDWIMTYGTAPIEERVRMLTEMMQKARYCLDMVPPEQTPSEEQPPSSAP